MVHNSETIQAKVNKLGSMISEDKRELYNKNRGDDVIDISDVITYMDDLEVTVTELNELVRQVQELIND
jgi:hypothetical protein